MTFPLSIVLYEPGPGGIPTTTNPRNLAGWAESYDDSQVTQFGHETLRITGRVPSREAAADWAARLMSSVEVTALFGRLRFSGFLNEVTIPAFDTSVSLTNMANVIISRWGDPDGKQGTVTVSNAASIARYGRKERVLNESISLEADAMNRATMVLGQIAEPPNKEIVTTEKGNAKDGFIVNLTFCGWAEALKWLTTSSTTETTQASTTQVQTLLTAYNAVNNFFDTAAASITATGHAATQFCPPDTTYYERIDKLLAFGDTSQRRITWGFYGRAITIGVAACASPDTIAYYYSKEAGKLWDTSWNEIDPWDWAPDVMTENVDVIGAPPAAGAIASLTRKYIRRATLRIGKDGLPFGTLEPDDVESLPDLVANPVSKNTGITQRHQVAEARIRDAMGSRTIRTDNASLWNSAIGALRSEAGGTNANNAGTLTVPSNSTIDLGGGAVTTGGGSISTGGGSVTNTGGGAIDLGTGSGIGGGGSSGVITAGGTIGRVAEFGPTGTSLRDSTVAKTGAGLLTLSTATAQTLTVTEGGTLELGGFTLNLDSNVSKTGGGALTLHSTSTVSLTITGSIDLTGSGGATGMVLMHDGTRFAPATLVAADVSAAPSDAKYIVQQAHAGLSNEQATGALATGLLKSTTTTGVLSIAVAGTDYAEASHSHSGFIDGSGATDRLPYFSDANTITSSANLTWNGGGLGLIGNLTISGAAGALYIIERDGAGTWIQYADGGIYRLNLSGTGDLVTINTSGRISSAATSIVLDTQTLTLSDGNLTKSGAGDLTLSAAGAYTVTVPGTGTIPLGTGTTGRATEWTGTNTIAASTLAKTGAGVLTFSAGSAYTVTVTSSGTLDLDGGTLSLASGNLVVNVATENTLNLDASAGGVTVDFKASGDVPVGAGTAGRVAYYTGANQIASDTLYWDATNNRLGVGGSPGVALDVAGTAAAAQVSIGSNSGTHVLELTGSGDAAKTTGTTWTVTSDARTKTILERYTLGMDYLRRLPPVAVFERNGRFGTTKGERGVGYIAQELLGIADDWIVRRMVKEWPDDAEQQEVLKLDHYPLAYVQTNSILELDRRLAAVERQLGIGG